MPLKEFSTQEEKTARLEKIYEGIMESRDIARVVKNTQVEQDNVVLEKLKGADQQVKAAQEKIPLFGKIVAKFNEWTKNAENFLTTAAENAANLVVAGPFEKKEERLAKEWSQITGQPFPFISEDQPHSRVRKDYTPEMVTEHYSSAISNKAYEKLVETGELEPRKEAGYDNSEIVNERHHEQVIQEELVKEDPNAWKQYYNEDQIYEIEEGIKEKLGEFVNLYAYPELSAWDMYEIREQISEMLTQNPNISLNEVTQIVQPKVEQMIAENEKEKEFTVDREIADIRTEADKQANKEEMDEQYDQDNNRYTYEEPDSTEDHDDFEQE